MERSCWPQGVCKYVREAGMWGTGCRCSERNGAGGGGGWPPGRAPPFDAGVLDTQRFWKRLPRERASGETHPLRTDPQPPPPVPRGSPPGLHSASSTSPWGPAEPLRACSPRPALMHRPPLSPPNCPSPPCLPSHCLHGRAMGSESERPGFKFQSCCMCHTGQVACLL